MLHFRRRLHHHDATFCVEKSSCFGWCRLVLGIIPGVVTHGALTCRTDLLIMKRAACTKGECPHGGFFCGPALFSNCSQWDLSRCRRLEQKKVAVGAQLWCFMHLIPVGKSVNFLESVITVTSFQAANRMSGSGDWFWGRCSRNKHSFFYLLFFMKRSDEAGAFSANYLCFMDTQPKCFPVPC